MKNKILTGIVLLLPLSFSMAKEGTTSQICLSKPETEIAQCLADEYAKYDLALNNNYKEIMKNLSDEDKKAFKAQQIAWIKEKEKRCTPLANENGKQACLLDATILKNNQLEDKLIDVMLKVFEGDWQSSFSINGSYEKVGFIFFQNGKNICGILEETWSNKLFSGQIHFRLTSQNTAVSVKSCGREGSFLGSKPCFDPSDIFVESPYPYEQWETNQNIKIQICNGELYSSYYGEENYPKNCSEAKKTQISRKKNNLTPNRKKDLIKENPWLKACLNNSKE